MELTEKDYALWLFNVPGIGNASADKLLCSGLSCRDIYGMKAKELSDILSAKQVKAIEKSRFDWDFDREKRKLEEKGIRFISRIEPDFPEKLKNIHNPPFALYVKGKLPDPQKPSVAIIGARMCSEYGRYAARHFGRGLALSGVQIISGMARGVDGIAQAAALDAGGTTFGVLGCGPDICYPEENRLIYDGIASSGGIISEYAPGTMPESRNFPVRNRIISALADVVLVVEARKKSGTQITVDTALEQGREVLAVPGRVTDRLSDGCNSIISQGAGIAVDVEDVLDRLRIRTDACKAEEEDGIFEEEEFEEIDPKGTSKTAKNGPLSLEELILETVDIIPVSTSYIMDELYRRGVEVTIPMLIGTLMDLTSTGQIAQNGAYYRKISA
ncbi:DNA-processing protein DprA [Butyrivibrio sp. FCS014]|uniref:DNA-processing protein DprA n=1 Tax=Butyrivibrio sp. FCS014 TaxID=1408304 RepID=UPI0004657AA0|nr:DNA-processing protein DprA [Butyrivibrio sp. FCS014]